MNNSFSLQQLFKTGKFDSILISCLFKLILLAEFKKKLNLNTRK